jgi:hypothetical protein
MNYNAKNTCAYITSGTLRIQHDLLIESANMASKEGRCQPSQTTRVKSEHAFSLAILSTHYRSVGPVLPDYSTATARACKVSSAGWIAGIARFQRPRQGLHGRLRTCYATGTV